MRRLSTWLGSVARRDREGGRARVAMLRMKTLKGRETWGCGATIESRQPGPFNPGPGELKSLALNNRKNGRSVRWRLHSTYTVIVW